jgi:ferrous iron transport protein B
MNVQGAARAVSQINRTPTPCVALVGNPNVGKTSLFNRLTHLLAKTSNFPGTTVELRSGSLAIDGQSVQLVDLPGLYSLDAKSPDEEVAKAFLLGERSGQQRPDGVVVVVDATHLERTLFIVGQALDLGLPIIIALNMIDLAEKKNIRVDHERLAHRLGCPVIPISARNGFGLDQLQAAMLEMCVGRNDVELPVLEPAPCTSCSACPYADGYRWAATLARDNVTVGKQAGREFTESADRLLTNKWLGPLFFATVMLVVFTSVFWLAQFPMGLLDQGMGILANRVSAWLPAGDVSNLLTEGVIGGAGSVIVFLPQICVLFFALAMLEDCGYLSRAVLVVDGWMRKVGLPGQAFVPLLAAHACAIPAIMATRVIENRRDRLTAILVIPLMTCSARLPVYSMVAAMLFPNNALRAALLFAAAYVLGMVAAFAVAWLLRLTILPGQPASLILDLPPYRVPSLTTALRQAWDRGLAFLRDAGTIILLISVVIWALSNYPKMSDSDFSARLAEYPASAFVEHSGDRSFEEGVHEEQLPQLRARLAQEHSILGRAGKIVQPVFEPLGFDWKTSVGVLASFAAREVVVSTMSVLYDADGDSSSFFDRMATAKRADGSPVFGPSTSISLLVFFVLAMQCMPTQAVTRKETGSWNWAAFQFVYMSVLAYGAAFLAKRLFDVWG